MVLMAAAVASGPSRAPNWSAPRSDGPTRAFPSMSADGKLSWGGPPPMSWWGGVGLYPMTPGVAATKERFP